MPAKIQVEFGGLHVLAKTERCPRCNQHVGREQATFQTSDKPSRRLALFLTSDGYYVSNKKFRDFCIAQAFTGVEFVPMENGYFALKVARRVAYDLSRLWVNQTGWCTECQSFRSNLVAPDPRPIATSEGPIGPLEFVESYERWGEEYGLRTAQHPDLIVGDSTKRAIEAENFRGIFFSETV